MKKNTHFLIGVLLCITGCKEITWKTETIVHADGTTDRNLNLLTNIEYDSLGYFFQLPGESEGWRLEKILNVDATRERKKDVFNLKIEKFYKEHPFRIPADYRFRDWRDSTVHAENRVESSVQNYFLFKDYFFREVFTSSSPKDPIQRLLDEIAGLFSDHLFQNLKAKSPIPVPDSLIRVVREKTRTYFVREICKADTTDNEEIFLHELMKTFQGRKIPLTYEQISASVDSLDKALDPLESGKADQHSDRLLELIKKYRAGIDEIHFEHTLNLPGMIREANGTYLSGNQVQWKFSANHYILSDYIMEANSRKIQWHIVIILAVVIYWGVRRLRRSRQ